MYGDGENALGSEFLVTLGQAEMLDGYNVVIGEMVEGDEVLKEIEQSLTRQGTFQHEIKIDATGTK